MALKTFADDDVGPLVLSTQNLLYLKQCDSKLNGLRNAVISPEDIDALGADGRMTKLYYMTQAEADRSIAVYEQARRDIVERLSTEEKAEYVLYQAENAPKELSEEEQAELTKRLDQNKDRVSH